MPTIQDQVREQARALAAARRQAEVTEAAWQAIYEPFCIEHTDLLADRDLAAQQLAAADAALRESCVSYYEQTADTHPGFGITVTLRRASEIVDLPALLKWAQKAMPAALAVDKKALEGLPAERDVPGFRRFVKPTPAIPSNLKVQP